MCFKSYAFVQSSCKYNSIILLIYKNKIIIILSKILKKNIKPQQSVEQRGKTQTTWRRLSVGRTYNNKNEVQRIRTAELLLLLLLAGNSDDSELFFRKIKNFNS